MARAIPQAWWPGCSSARERRFHRTCRRPTARNSSIWEGWCGWTLGTSPVPSRTSRLPCSPGPPRTTAPSYRSRTCTVKRAAWPPSGRWTSVSNAASARSMGRTHLCAAFLLPAGLCAAWTLYAGKDVSWDLLNYHFYAPFQLLQGRLQQDFFAASAQSYLNPIGYLPFYAMVASGWHSVAVSVLLALAHSVNLGLLYMLSRRLFAHLPSREGAAFSLLAAALGAATAVFWATVGSSFLDPLLSVLVLAGLLLLLDPHPRAARGAALAGALFGAAAALKYSNAIFGLPAFALALAMPGLSGA